MTNTNPINWSLDRIVVIVALVAQLIVVGSFLLTWNDKVNRLIVEMDRDSTTIGEIQKLVYKLDTKMEFYEKQFDALERRFDNRDYAKEDDERRGR